MSRQDASSLQSTSLEMWLSVAEPTAFAWEQLAEWFLENYGARLVGPSLSGHKCILSLRLLEASVPRLLEDVESEVINALVIKNGGRFIQEICQGAKCLYSHLPALPATTECLFEDVSTDELRALLVTHRIDVILLTTTDEERKALHAAMTPLPGRERLVEGSLDQVTYRLGRFGRYLVAHAESTMGSQARQAAALTVSDVIRELSPKAILIIGIAFGLRPEKQRLGDVIVAETVIPYELQRLGVGVTHRGQPLACGNILSERFRTRRVDWRFPRGEDTVKVFQGELLSGEKLVDNHDFREALRKAFPNALGGEMEGAGAYAATSRQGVEVILLKAVCDWGDGTKTDRAQPFAAAAAVSLARHVLGKKDVLASLHASGSGFPAAGTSALAAPARSASDAGSHDKSQPLLVQATQDRDVRAPPPAPGSRLLEEGTLPLAAPGKLPPETGVREEQVPSARVAAATDPIQAFTEDSSPSPRPPLETRSAEANLPGPEHPLKRQEAAGTGTRDLKTEAPGGARPESRSVPESGDKGGLAPGEPRREQTPDGATEPGVDLIPPVNEDKPMSPWRQFMASSMRSKRLLLAAAVALALVPFLKFRLLFEPRITLRCRLTPQQCLARIEPADDPAIPMWKMEATELEQVVALSEWACTGYEDAPSCFRLGAAYQLGLGVEEDLGKAAGFYEKACASGRFMIDCFYLGNLYMNGQGVTRDEAKGAGFYEKACASGQFMEACLRLGLFYAGEQGVEKNWAKAAGFYEKACASGQFAQACDNLLQLRKKPTQEVRLR